MIRRIHRSIPPLYHVTPCVSSTNLLLHARRGRGLSCACCVCVAFLLFCFFCCRVTQHEVKYGHRDTWRKTHNSPPHGINAISPTVPIFFVQPFSRHRTHTHTQTTRVSGRRPPRRRRNRRLLLSTAVAAAVAAGTATVPAATLTGGAWTIGGAGAEACRTRCEGYASYVH